MTHARNDGPPAATSALELNGICRRFGRRWVLRGIDLQLARGETLGLMGRNGSGKTTLLRIISTALKPTRGSGRVFGHDLVREADAVRERVGVLGHAPGLYEDLTGEENLRFALGMLGWTPDARRIADLLERVGLAGVRERVRAYSAGMRRRLALARVLMVRPDLLLLDEPFASFDEEGITLVCDIVREVTAAGGAAVIATHDALRAGRIVDRIVRIEAGLLADADTAAEPPQPGAIAAPLRVLEGGD